MNVQEFYESLGLVLTPMGARWKSTCPFHLDTDPSFVIYPNGDFHCFGCWEHGTSEDIRELFHLEYVLCPDVTLAKDPILDGARKIKQKLEGEVAYQLINTSTKTSFMVWDALDKFSIELNAYAAEVNTTLVDLISFANVTRGKIKKILVTKKKETFS